MLKYWVIFLLSLSFLHHHYAFASNEQQIKKGELSRITAQIQKVKDLLFHDKNRKAGLQRELRKNEEVIAKLALELERLDREIAQQTTQLKILQIQQIEQQEKLTIQRAALVQQVRTAYLLKRNHPIKLLLTQHDPHSVARILSYYSYLNKTRLDFMKALSQALEQLQHSTRQVQQQTQILQTSRTTQLNKQKEFEASKRTRQQILVGLNANIQTRAQKLDTLIGNQKALEQIIKTLQKKPTNTIPLFRFATTNAPFTRLRGKLPWPIRGGSIGKHFGTPIEQSELKYNGVLLKAREGQKVQAIYKGQVVFANWLQGFGLLMIVDHGNGYMSLYGQNHALYKKTGDSVKPGDVVASVGNSGGHDQNGLYFEIRHNGHPINPELWCQNA